MSLPYEAKDPPESWIGWNRLTENFSHEDLTPQEQEELDKTVKYIVEFQEASILQTIVEKSCSSPDIVAICVVIGGAFGNEFQDELIQFQDGSYLHSTWGSSNKQIEERCRSDLDIDLPTELQNLRNENYKLRGGENENPELETGEGLGRYGDIYVAVGADIEWLLCERPMEGKYKNNAVNRLFQAVYGHLSLI